MNYYNENDPKMAAWLKNLVAAGHVPPGDVDERSIVEVKPHELEAYKQCHFFAGIGGWPLACRIAGIADDYPIWTGSCPCQPLSLSGHQKGHADERHLWPAFHSLITERRPARIVGEQVASPDGYEWFAGIRADLEGDGYACGGADLPAACVGSPQIRQRIYWCADATGINGDAHGSMVAGGAGRAQIEFGRFPRVFDDGRWTPETNGGGERLPSIVRSYHGLSETLAGFGNAIVPQVGALFIKAAFGI